MRTLADARLAFCSLVVAVLAVREGSAQTSRQRASGNKETAGTVLAPRRAGSGSEAKHAAWVARVNQACRAFRSGRRGPAEEVFRELLEADKGNPVARKYLTEIAIERGELDEARAILGSVPAGPSAPRGGGERGVEPVPFVDWYVIGPFPYRGEQSFKEALDPEKSEFDPEARYNGAGRICRWKRVPGPRVDFRSELEITGPGVAYGICEFTAVRSGWIRLGIASADAIKVWLNDELVHENFVRRRIREDDDEAYVWVKQGKNRLRVKVDSRGEEFRFYLQAYEEVELPSPKFLDSALAGLKALRRKDWAEAEAKLLDAERLRPGVPEVAIGMAEALLRQDNLVAARSWASRGLLGRPESPSGLAVYGEIMLRLDKPLKAFDSFRAAYRASEYTDERVLALWIESARTQRWDLQEGLALLDKARGQRAAKDAAAAQKSVEEARPKLETTFVGLADLSVYCREAGDRAGAADLGLRALAKLTPEQVALHCAADWLLDLVKDLRETQPANQEARERVLRLVEQVDPTRSDLIRELLAVQPPAGRSAVSAKVEALLKKRPEKALYKEYVARLFAAGDHERCVEICRQGLAAGIVSRTLRYRQAQSLLALKRYDEAEEVFRGLLEEKDYAERASDGLAKLAQARQRDGARPAAAASP